MKSIRALGLVLVMVCAASATVAAAPQNQSTSPDDIIYDLTIPWPFRDRPDTGARLAAPVDGDADGDGVVDSKDRCPGTPSGAVVDANGCPVDSDGDGVPDGLDRCERTPKGATVDRNGCPSDSDGDGVLDGIDQCADTSKDLAVDKKGCPIPIGDVGQEFLEKNAVAFNVEFASDKWDIRPSSYAALDRVGEVLNDWTDAEVEVAGHTDSQGSDKHNELLSQRRAESVKAYLIRKFPRIRAENLKPVGFGEKKPIASNDTAEGRASNRRVEFTLLNSDELKKTIDTRRYKRRSE